MKKFRSLIFVTIFVCLLFPEKSIHAQLKPGANIPQVELKDMKGKTYNLKQLQGKILIIHFWHDD